MRKFLYVFVIMVLLISAGCAPKPESKEKLVVAMELQFPPFETTDENGEPAGISVEMAKDLAKFMGRELEIRNTSWTGLIPTLQTGKADLILSSMSDTAERRKVVDFSDAYAVAGLTLLLAKDSHAEGFKDLNNPDITLAVKSGTIGAILAKEQLSQANIHNFDDVATCVLEVAQGKADAFIYDALTVYENHKKHADTTRMNLETIKGTGQPWAMAVKKGNSELLKHINAYILDSQQKGRFEEISANYLGDMLKFFEANNIPSFWDVSKAEIK